MHTTRTNMRWAMLALACAAMTLPLAQQAHARSAPIAREQLLDRIQIEDMMIEYYSLLNGHGRHDVGAYFTDDAVLIANGARIEGKAAIQGLYDSGGDPRVMPGNSYRMILSNPHIVVRGSTATMESVWTGYLSENVYTAPRLVEQGTERTAFVKRNGAWLIASREIAHLGGRPDVPARQ